MRKSCSVNWESPEIRQGDIGYIAITLVTILYYSYQLKYVLKYGLVPEHDISLKDGCEYSSDMTRLFPLFIYYRIFHTGRIKIMEGENTIPNPSNSGLHKDTRGLMLPVLYYSVQMFHIKYKSGYVK